MIWKTTKQELNEAIDELSARANIAVKETLARRVEYPAEVGALFEAIGKIKELLDHLSIKET